MSQFQRIALALVLSATANAAGASQTNTAPVEIFACPAKGSFSRSINVSSGTALWSVEGPSMTAGTARAAVIDPASIPAGWIARLPGAAWVQALPQKIAAPHPPGDYVFVARFRVMPGKRMPKLLLSGQVAGDEGFDLNLVEPSPPGQWIGGGSGGTDDSPGVVAQTELQTFALGTSADGSGKSLGSRPGLYQLRLTLRNTAAAPTLGLLAQLKLTMNCDAKP